MPGAGEALLQAGLEGGERMEPPGTAAFTGEVRKEELVKEREKLLERKEQTLTNGIFKNLGKKGGQIASKKIPW